ncbi:Ig-like domain-containing protein [Okibacterium endophyticum]
MIVVWLRRYRSAIATVTSGMVVAALVVTVAVVSAGYRAQRIDLGDAAVWVANEARQAIGRANTEVLELNTAVESASTRIDVLQDGANVLLVDHGSSSIDIVDPATATIVETAPMPSGEVEVSLAGSRVTMAAGGDLWFSSVEDLGDFNADTDPALSLGDDAVTAVSPDGDVFVFSPETSEVSKIATDEDVVSQTSRVDLGEDDGLGASLTVIGDTWALLSDDTVHTAGASTSLKGVNGAVLEQPRTRGSTVLVAHDSGLLRVPLSGGDASVVSENPTGEPARPVTVGDCAFAAWADGSVVRSCAGEDPENSTIETSGLARPVFAVNSGNVLLNDAVTGASWAVQRSNELIDNWDDLIDVVEDEQEVEENDEDIPPEYEQTQEPPVAIADEFGARPGKTSTLPVLLNDYDPNGDVLAVTQLTALPEAIGSLELINNDQQVQVRLQPTATGQFTFDYTITDGRGGSATAAVTVTVRQPGENSAPVQMRQTKATVVQGGRLTMQVLGDWIDPDSDPFYLTEASVPAPDNSQFKPDGTVIFTDAGQGGDVKDVGLAVSDGMATGNGVFAVTVKPTGEVPIDAEPFMMTTNAGEEILVEPLDHVRGGSAPLRLVNVQATDKATITPDYGGGTFRFSSTTIGSHNLEYSVTDGVDTATGVVRIDVKEPAEVGAKPITVPHSAFIEERSSKVVDVLAGDRDPSGGVLVVTGTYNVPPESGVRVEIIEQRMLRITLTRPLDGPVSFTYSVSNGVAEAEGTVTVIEIPTPAKRQPPVAYPDTVSVRVGDAIDIPVLRNDTHPNGDPLALDPELTSNVPANGGLLFVSGTVLRYLAPDKPGDYTAVYRTVAPDGQWADAELRINVREVDAASNAPPIPLTVTARVLSGESVRITIPLSGIDPDGDSVQLIGQASNPEKGSVIDAGSDYFDYEAGAYSTGTDTFTYTVVDALGKQATGTVRVGISPKLDGSRNPIAVEDEVVVRPGRTVSVQVLLNDSDPDGGALAISSIEATTEGAEAEIDGDIVRITVPEGNGRYGFIYEIRNKWGGTSSNFITVIAREDAPLSRPIARDAVLALDDILDRDSVDVNVLSGVFFADGPVSSLDLSIPAGYSENASVTANNRVRVRIVDESQIIPFDVAHPDDPAITATAFIWVPGRDDALPQVRAGVKRISVVSEDSVTIELEDYVVAADGKAVRLTDAANVRATHANGADLVVDSNTLSFTSADQYFGPASISFEVTDGTSADDPDGRKATLVLPIDVTPRENQPPVFQGGSIDLEPGQEKSIELVRLTTYPYADDLDELTYSILDPKPAGFSARIDGQTLVIKASDTLKKGKSSRVLIGVKDAINDGTSGGIGLLAVPSTRPLAVPATDSAVVERGETTTIDVLANDGATNPFPTAPLRVVSVRGLDGGGLPAGVTITPNSTNSKLAVSVSADAAAADAVLQYQVADATDDPDRYAWGTVRISVQDRPEPVTGVRVTGFADRSISLSWAAGGFNNSPIEGYTVTLTGGGGVVGTTSCPSTTCSVPTPGNGSDNKVRVQVTAKNGIGDSDAATFAEPVWSDIIPAKATELNAAPLDGGLRISWARVPTPGHGSPVSSYVVTVNGNQIGNPSCDGARCTVETHGLPNGSEAKIQVSARNDAYPALAVWNWADGGGTPFGAPRAGGIRVSSDAEAGTATVNWDAFEGRGDGIAGYFVQLLNSAATPSGAQACSVSSPAPGTVKAPSSGGNVIETAAVGGTSHTFKNLTGDDTTYSFVVWGYNRAGCAVTGVASENVRPRPGPVTAINGEMQNIEAGTVWDYYVSSVSPGGYTYEIRAPGGAWQSFSGSGYPRQILSLSYGQPVSFEVRACNVKGIFKLCGEPLAQTASRASVTLAMTGVEYDPETGVISWLTGPQNGALVASYSCKSEESPTVGHTVGSNSCTLSSPVEGKVKLLVTVDGRSREITLP